MSKLTDEQRQMKWREGNIRYTEAKILAATEPLLQRIAELERQLEETREDAERLNWLAFNPVEALDLFGRVTGDFSSWPKWIRQDIDAAMQKGQS